MDTSTIIDPDTGKPATYRYDPTDCDHEYLDVFIVEDGVVCCGCGTHIPNGVTT